MHLVIGETASRMSSTEKFGVIKDATKENNNKSQVTKKSSSTGQ